MINSIACIPNCNLIVCSVVTLSDSSVHATMLGMMLPTVTVGPALLEFSSGGDHNSNARCTTL